MQSSELHRQQCGLCLQKAAARSQVSREVMLSAGVRKSIRHLRSALFWDITQCTVAILYPHFGQPISLIFKGQEVCPLKMGQRGCHETWVRTCHSTLRNIPEEHRSHLPRGVSQKSRIIRCMFYADLEETHLSGHTVYFIDR
jgi:hypothetical protein